jgi:hypothetical protein
VSFFTGFGVWTGLTLVHCACCTARRSSRFERPMSCDSVRRDWSRILGVVALVMVRCSRCGRAHGTARHGRRTCCCGRAARDRRAPWSIAARAREARLRGDGDRDRATVGSLFASLFPMSSSRASTATTASPSRAARLATTPSR